MSVIFYNVPVIRKDYMISTKLFCKEICSHLGKKTNDSLKLYLKNKDDNIKKYNECLYERSLCDCILLKCVRIRNIQGLFILLSSGICVSSVNCYRYKLIEMTISNGDFDTCFLLKSLGCTSKCYSTLQKCLQTYILVDIEPLFRVYSSETFSKAFSSFFISRKYTHDRLMDVFNLLASNMKICLEYVYVIPGEKDFIEHLLKHNYTDPTEMWNDAMFHGLRLVEIPVTSMDECMIDTLELSVKHGADVRFLYGYGRKITWDELALQIRNTRKVLRYKRYDHGRRMESRKIKRTYKHVLKLCRPIRRQPFIIKRIRGFSSEDEPSDIDNMFIDLPLELFGRVLSFIV